MRLGFFGTSEFAVPVLEALAPHVVLVVTQPDRPSGRKLELKPTAVKSRAQELGLEVATPERCRSKPFVERIRALELDASVVVSYGQILSQALLDAPRRGCFNLHASLLPRHRGAAPIQRAILAGDTQTGVCLMQMDAGLDTGDLIASHPTGIGPEETAGELHDRLAPIAAELAAAWMPALVQGEYTRTPQPLEGVTYAAKIEKHEAELSVTLHAGEAYNRYRAFTPWPGAFLRTRWGVLKLLRTRLTPALHDAQPGTLLDPEGPCVAFVGGALALIEVQLEGRRPIRGHDFLLGARLAPGDRLV